MNVMLQVSGVKKHYSGFDIDVAFDVEGGHIFSLLGPSGSGKTTTLRLIAGFEQPDSGTISVGGRDVTPLAASARKIGFVFQDYTLFPHLSVFGNVAYGLRARRAPRRRIESRVAELLSMVNLAGYERRDVSTLSGGEQQRIALARALAIDPQLLLLDEPFSALDEPLRRELRLELVRLRRELGITIVFVTHSREEALSISDRIAIMSGGEVVQVGTPAELYEKPADEFAARFVGAANVIRGTIERREGGSLFIRSFREFEIATDDRTANDPGEQLTVMVRPHRLRFCDKDASNGFPVSIVSRQFYAHYYEYRCRHGEEIFVVFDANRREVGEESYLGFEPRFAVVLPEGFRLDRRG